MKRYFSSFAVRLFLFVLMGVLLASSASYLIIDYRVKILRADNLIERAADLLTTLDETSLDARGEVASGYRAQLLAPDIAAHRTRDEEATQALSRRLGRGWSVTVYEPAHGDCALRRPGEPPLPRRLSGDPPPVCRIIGAHLPSGSDVRFTMRWDSSVYFARTGVREPGIIIFHLLLIGLAAFVARLAAAPVEQLAKAAQRLGADLNAPALKESGPAEVAAAARAFNRMQQQIRAQLVQRTYMLAAITHDLRTPLTRMRLRLEEIADPAMRERLSNDIDAMERLIKEGLHFAQAGQSADQVGVVDFDGLVRAIAKDATDAGQSVELSGATQMSVRGSAEGLTRAITNLVDNAVKFGDRAILTLDRKDQGARLTIADRGPGLSAEGLARAGEPFWRADPSRSRDTGGVGLGIAIAKAIVARYGGELALANDADGGLLATLTLPQASGDH